MLEASDEGVHLAKTSALCDHGDGKLRLAEHVARLIESILSQPTTKAHTVSLLKDPPETAHRQPRTTRALWQKPIGTDVLLYPFDCGPHSLVALGEIVLVLGEIVLVNDGQECARPQIRNGCRSCIQQ
jgi:hypothetical protein